MSNLDKYEEYVIAPGETILELLDTNCMTQLDLANKTGINKKTINEIIKGKAPITISTALKLEYVFNIPASFWNNLESSYREALERQKDLQSIKDDVKYLENIPYLEISKRNWVEKTKNPIEKVINLRKFFSVASLSFDTDLKRKLAFRKKENENFSIESLYCWLRYGEIEANKVEYPKFDVEKLKSKVNEIRKLANKSFLEQYLKIQQILFECGVSLIYEPHLPHTYVSGVSYKVNCNKAIIMISDRGKRDDILWFTLFHEIAHLIKHSKKEFFIDEENNEKNNIEIEADDYARNILIGILVASILWWNKYLYKVFDPYLTILNSLPKVALGPILIIWIGANTNSIIAMALLISAILSIMNIYNGFSNTDVDKIKLMKSFNASKWQIYKLLILKGNISTIISSLKINISMCLIGVIMGELLVSKEGIGYLIMYGSQVFNLNLVMTGVFLLGIVSFILYALVSYIEKKLVYKN